MLNYCIQVHACNQQAALQAQKETEPVHELNNPLTSKFVWWLITAERTVRETTRTNAREVVKIERKLAGYGELLSMQDDANLTFYGKYAEVDGGDYVQIINPVLIVRDNTVHLVKNGEEIPLWPIVQVSSGTRHDERYFFTYAGAPLFIRESNGYENSTVTDRGGRSVTMLELIPGEAVNLEGYNINLNSLGWAYSVKLNYLIRISKSVHVAIGDGRPYILSKPCSPADYGAMKAQGVIK